MAHRRRKVSIITLRRVRRSIPRRIPRRIHPSLRKKSAKIIPRLSLRTNPRMHHLISRVQGHQHRLAPLQAVSLVLRQVPTPVMHHRHLISRVQGHQHRLAPLQAVSLVLRQVPTPVMHHRPIAPLLQSMNSMGVRRTIIPVTRIVHRTQNMIRLLLKLAVKHVKIKDSNILDLNARCMIKYIVNAIRPIQLEKSL